MWIFKLLVVGLVIALIQADADRDALEAAARDLRIVLPKIKTSNRTTYVRNGKDANRIHWPFIVPIFQVAGGRTAHICGGSIIHPMFIVTAAHCFRKQIRNNRGVVTRVEMDDDKRGYIVHVGDYNIASLRDGAIKVAIDRIIVHERYRGLVNNDPYDIALIKLKTPLKYNNFVKPIPLPQPNQAFDTGTFNCHAAGWGLMETGRNRVKATVLQQLDAKILPAQSCKNFWREWMNPTNMCLGNGSKSQCRGDSGGPAVCPLNNAFVLAGIISFGSDDCDSRPGVLLKIPPFVGWINQQVSKYAIRG